MYIYVCNTVLRNATSVPYTVICERKSEVTSTEADGWGTTETGRQRIKDTVPPARYAAHTASVQVDNRRRAL